MEMETIKFLNWLEGYHWSSKVPFGTKGIGYEFTALWNTRSEAFEITIESLDGEVIVGGRKMTLGVNLFEHCYNPLKPECSLIPLTNNAALERITYEAMNSGEVKLYHLTKKRID